MLVSPADTFFCFIILSLIAKLNSACDKVIVSTAYIMKKFLEHPCLVRVFFWPNHLKQTVPFITIVINFIYSNTVSRIISEDFLPQYFLLLCVQEVVTHFMSPLLGHRVIEN